MARARRRDELDGAGSARLPRALQPPCSGGGAPLQPMWGMAHPHHSGFVRRERRIRAGAASSSPRHGDLCRAGVGEPRLLRGDGQAGETSRRPTRTTGVSMCGWDYCAFPLIVKLLAASLRMGLAPTRTSRRLGASPQRLADRAFAQPPGGSVAEARSATLGGRVPRA